MSKLSNELKKEYVDMLYKCINLGKTVDELAKEKFKLEMALYTLRKNLEEIRDQRDKTYVTLSNMHMKHLSKIKENEKEQ